MPAPRNEEATRVRYRRSNERRRAAELIQVWRSDVTGREFEVRESRSYAPSEELEPGAEGFLDFTAGAPSVTRRPLERSERLGRYQERRRRAVSTQQAYPAPRRNLGAWLLVGTLVVVILWVLL